MPLPRHSVALPSMQLAADAASKGVTELRVHGVGGSPPDATLGDLAPEQVMGDAIAGFYRTSDHTATQPDRDARRDVDRHVEVYSWGGLTSRSKIRVLWLALLPFLFANLAGWMCSASTRNSAWRFRLHRLAAGLCALALTVNAALIAVMISADVNAYQTSRAGLAGHQWWLAPLNWDYVKGHPARQVTVGVLVVVLFVLALVLLAWRSWRYEAVRPPYRVQNGRKDTARKAAADTLAKGLADQEFWDGEGTVRLLTWLHVAVVGGFLAIMLGVTARALAGGSPQAAVLGWTGIALGAATITLAVAYVCLDALDTPSMGTPGAKPTMDAFAKKLRGLVVYLLVPAGAGLICSGCFAWLQPGAPSVRAADLPGMAGVTGWTALGIAVAVGIALISVLLGLRNSGGTMVGGSWVTLMLGFGSLNILLLGAEIWVAHLVGPVTSDAAEALSAKPGKIYLSPVITSGVPLLAWAVVLAVVVFGAVEALRWRAAKLPKDMAGEYEKQAAEFRTGLSQTLNVWYWSGLTPFRPLGDTAKKKGDDKKWQRQIARVQFLGRAPHDAIWLLWIHHPGATGHGRVRVATGSSGAAARPQRRHRPGRLGVARAGGVPVRGVEQPRQAAHDRDLVGCRHVLAPVLPPAVPAVLRRTGRARPAAPDVVAARQRRPGHAGRAQPGNGTRGRGAGPDRVPSRGRPSGPDHVRLAGLQALRLGLPRLLRPCTARAAGPGPGREGQRLAELLLPDGPYRRIGGARVVRGGRRPGGHRVPRPGALLLRVRPAAARVHGPLRLLGGPPGLGCDQRRRGRASRRAGRHLPERVQEIVHGPEDR